MNIENEPPIAAPLSPPRLPASTRQAFCYDRAVVEELFSRLLGALEKSERETLYWATMYEESQKELFTLRERLRKEDEADYLDEAQIPDVPRRSSKPSLESGEDSAPRWLSLKAAVKSAMSAVVGGQSAYATLETG